MACRLGVGLPRTRGRRPRPGRWCGSCWNGLQLAPLRIWPARPSTCRCWSRRNAARAASRRAWCSGSVGLYRGLWRFASVPDLCNIAQGRVPRRARRSCSACSSTTASATVPRTVLLLYPFALVGLLGAPRLLYRVWKDSRIDAHAHAPRVRVLILGAGRAGEALVRDLRRTGAYHPVGFLDDTARLRGARCRACRCSARSSDAGRRSRARPPRELLVIAMPSADADADAARGRAVRTHRPAVPHGAAPAGRARRPLAAGRAEGSRDRGPARPRAR